MDKIKGKEKNKTQKNKKKNITKDITKGALILESIIYIIGLLVSVYIYNVGGYFINLIPILFIIGLVGKVVFDRPIITTLLAIIFNIFIMYETNGTSDKSLFLSSIYVGILVIAGEIVGQMYYLTYEKIKLKKRAKKIKIKDKNKVNGFEYSMPISVISVLFVVILMHSYINGNLIEYLVKKNNVKEYLKCTYADESCNLKIKNPRILFDLNSREYIFDLVDDKTKLVYGLVLRDNGYVEDKYYEALEKKNLLQKNNNINEILKGRIMSSNEYKNIEVTATVNNIIITKSIEEDSNEVKKEFSKQVYWLIDELQKNNLLTEITGVLVRIKKEDEIIHDIIIDKVVAMSTVFNEDYIFEAMEEEVVDNID